MAAKARRYCYAYPRPAVTVDLVLFSQQRPRQVLLVRRRQPPFAGAWALPGGFVQENEPLEVAARRELYEETGLRMGELEQLQAFGDPGRDPRGWTISIVFWGVLAAEAVRLRAGDDAAEAAWHPLTRLPALAFDHAHILAVARQRLRRSRPRRAKTPPADAPVRPEKIAENP
jgi:8-oxo-dGTP diphosphatase